MSACSLQAGVDDSGRHLLDQQSRLRAQPRARTVGTQLRTVCGRKMQNLPSAWKLLMRQKLRTKKSLRTVRTKEYTIIR